MKALNNSELEYMRRVRRLEWVASYQNEDPASVRSRYISDPRTPWWSLSYFQRKLLTSRSSSVSIFSHPRIDVLPNQVTTVKGQSLHEEKIQYDLKTKSICIPASACSSPKTSNTTVVFMRSFSGGQQLYVNQNGVVEYTIRTDVVETTKYALTCTICTVHRKLLPIGLEIVVNNNVTKIMLDQSYTMGMWQETTPVIVEVGGCDSKDTLLRITREMESFGFGLKKITLVPISNEATIIM
jgi:hypothetical protein